MASFTSEIDGPPTFSPTSPQFFKIIGDNTSRCSKLGIPKNFVAKYGGDLSSPVHLKIPSGSEWKVELRKWDGEVWFDMGWKKFSEFYTLEYGDLLVFRYEGNSKFGVCIFDKSATEIEYPITTPENEETYENDDSEDDRNIGSEDDSQDDCDSDYDPVGILDNFPDKRSRNPKEKSPLPCAKPHKKSGTSSSSGTDDFRAKKGGGGTSSTRRFQEQRIGCLGRMSPLPGSPNAIERAEAFKSQTPSSCLVAMRRSYIKGSALWLPLEFNKVHSVKDANKATLRISNGRTWDVDLKYYEHRNCYVFHAGWKKFAHDNNLEVGDVCVFVSSMNSVKPLFEVVIFRANEAANCNIDEEHKKKVPKVEEAVDEDDDSLVILENFPPGSPETDDTSSMAPQAHKRKRTSSSPKSRAGSEFLGAWAKVLK